MGRTPPSKRAMDYRKTRPQPQQRRPRKPLVSSASPTPRPLKNQDRIVYVRGLFAPPKGEDGLRVDREAAEWQALFTMVLLASFVLVIGLIMVVGDYGWLAIEKLEAREQQLQAELLSMQTDEERLRREVVALRSDPVYLEATARTMLGLAKPAERILRLPESLRVKQAETGLARLSR